jgi:cytochrome c556
MMSQRIATRLLAALITVALIASAPSAASGQTTQTQRVMRDKLAESEKLLAALVTSKWAELDKHARALRALTDQPGWDVIRLPEFAKQTAAFQRANQALIEAAGTRDQRTAVTAYNALVASCVECHRYVARARLAQQK